MDVHDSGQYSVTFEGYDDDVNEVEAEDVIPIGRK